MNMMIAAMLICCSSLRCVSLTPLALELMRGKNLTRPEPQNIGRRSRGACMRNGLPLPYYTAGFV